MTSAVYDHETHAYGKHNMVTLAEKDPVGARLNADSYAMYIASTGMNRDDYDKYTMNSGAHAHSSKCYDKLGNCP